MKPRIYTDTSVIGGCFDIEFKKHSIKLINEFKIGSKILSISDLTLKEIEGAPENIQRILNDIPESY